MTAYVASARFAGSSTLRARTQQKYADTRITFRGSSSLFASATYMIPRSTYNPPSPYAPNLERPTNLQQDIADVIGIVERMTDVLMHFSTAKGREASELRRASGFLNAYAGKLLVAGTLSDAMLDAFDAAYNAGITAADLDLVMQQLLSEEPSAGATLTVAQSAMIFVLSTQCRIIAGMTFTSRNDVDAVQLRMKTSFDTVRDRAADSMDSASYNAMLVLGAALSRHLADTARPLPRVVEFSLSPMPALTLAQRIYADGSRWEELVEENKTIHPAFMRPTGRALSA